MNSVPFLKKGWFIKKEHYSNFCTFEIVSLVNVPGHYLRKYGTYFTKMHYVIYKRSSILLLFHSPLWFTLDFHVVEDFQSCSPSIRTWAVRTNGYSWKCDIVERYCHNNWFHWMGIPGYTNKKKRVIYSCQQFHKVSQRTYKRLVFWVPKRHKAPLQRKPRPSQSCSFLYHWAVQCMPGHGYCLYWQNASSALKFSF